MTINAAFSQFPILTTDRLCLRQIQPDDAEAMFAILSDEAVMQFYGHEPHRSLYDTHQLIEQTQLSYTLHKSIRWGITLKGHKQLIGSCSFHHLNASTRRAETGYELHRSFWQQGLMYEAMAALLNYGFTAMELHRVEAIIDIANEASKGLLLKLGFTYEGNLRQRYFFHDHFVDEHYFGLLKQEWRA